MLAFFIWLATVLALKPPAADPSSCQREFFALPASAKQAVQMLNSPHFRGYTGVAGELTLGQPDQREQFDIMREDIVSGLPKPKDAWRRLIGPNQWPADMPAFKDRNATELATTVI